MSRARAGWTLWHVATWTTGAALAGVDNVIPALAAALWFGFAVPFIVGLAPGVSAFNQFQRHEEGR